MPYLLDKASRAAGEHMADLFQNSTKTAIAISAAQAREVLKEHNLQFIGKGVDRVVFAPIDRQKKAAWYKFWKQYEHSQDVVVAIDYRKALDAETSKQIYHLHRILSTLFPHNFPRILGSFTIPNLNGDPQLSGTFRQRIHPTRFWKEAQYPFQKVKEQLKQLDLPISLIDPGLRNYCIAADGGEYYMDLLEVKRHYDTSLWKVKPWPKEELLAFMRENNYSSTEILQVMKDIVQIEQLSEELDQKKEAILAQKTAELLSERRLKIDSQTRSPNPPSTSQTAPTH